ncbi:MAG: siderophore-interacting protein [Bdellovibrionota bacterium]|nr:siderophore-interacting protein [Bdellovibrionota bacterium]
MKKKNSYRNIQVQKSYPLCPHLQRVEFVGEDLNDFPSGEEGAYVKVILETDKNNIAPDARPKMRSYTIANFDSDNKVLTLDFLIKYHEGHTATWAKNSKPGDQIVIAGPGPRKIYDFPETDYFLMGDLTSINAVKAYLKLAPPTATGEAYIAVPSKEDIHEIESPSHIKIHWIDVDEKEHFISKLKNYTQLSENSIVFGAGEAEEINMVRRFLTKEKMLPTEKLFLSGYWKRGLTDEEYRLEKNKDRK